MALFHSPTKREQVMTQAKELASQAGGRATEFATQAGDRASGFATETVESAKPHVTTALLEAREKGLPLVAAGATYAADQALSAASRVKDRADDVAEFATKQAKQAAKEKRRGKGRTKLLLLIGVAVAAGAGVAASRMAKSRQQQGPVRPAGPGTTPEGRGPAEEGQNGTGPTGDPLTGPRP